MFDIYFARILETLYLYLHGERGEKECHNREKYVNESDTNLRRPSPFNHKAFLAINLAVPRSNGKY